FGNKNKKEDSTPRMAQREGLHPTNEFEAKAGDPPFTPDTRFAAGQIAEAQNDQDRAIAQYQQALKIDPNHQPSLYRLAAVYTQQQKFTEAQTLWQRYIKATKGAPAGYNNLGFCYEMAGDLGEAEKAFKTCIDRDPDDQTCRVNYGLMLARHG